MVSDYPADLYVLHNVFTVRRVIEDIRKSLLRTPTSLLFPPAKKIWSRNCSYSIFIKRCHNNMTNALLT